MSNSLTPTMLAKYNEIVETYAETGHPVSVSAKNQTVRALVNRDKLVVTSGNDKVAYVRPADEGSDDYPAQGYSKPESLGKRLKRSYNKNRKLMVRRLKKSKK